MEPNPSRRSYSTTEVAQRLGVTVPTVQRWVDAGVLLAWRTVGGHRRIDAASAERLFDEQSSAARGSVAVAAPATSVMIVDDNPDDRDLLTALVSSVMPEASIRLAENGFQALVAIGKAIPDVLITDIVMPHMDGIEMLRHLAESRALPPEAIIAVSSPSAVRLAALMPVFDGVALLTKPLEAEPFAAALRAAVGQRRAGRQPQPESASSLSV